MLKGAGHYESGYRPCHGSPELTHTQYRRPAHREADPSGEIVLPLNLIGTERAPRAISASCARCHGANCLGRGLGAFSKLAGQNPDYLDLSLQAYALVMRQVAVDLTAEQMRDAALYYASLTPGAGAGAR